MLSHSHFKVVTSESRGHLKAQPEISREFGFIFLAILGLQCARVLGCQGDSVQGLQSGRVLGCQSLSKLGLKRAVVLERIWVCWAWVPGVMLFFPYLVFWVDCFF